MIIFKANGVQYEFPEGWHDVTLQQFILYTKDIEPNTPEVIQESIKAAFLDRKPEEAAAIWGAIPKNDLAKTVYPFLAEYVEFWTGLDKGTTLGDYGQPPMRTKDLEKLFWAIETRLFAFSYNKDFKKFKHKKKTFYLPVKHMEQSTAIEFMQAAEYETQIKDLEVGKWQVIPQIMAVICHRKGERYNSNRLESRAKFFNSVTMDIVFNVSFFLLKLNNTLKENTLIYSLTKYLSTQRKQQQRLHKILDGT
jgi:hypothetical protein